MKCQRWVQPVVMLLVIVLAGSMMAAGAWVVAGGLSSTAQRDHLRDLQELREQAMEDQVDPVIP